MKYPPEHKPSIRRKIARNAGKLFRLKGYENTTIADLMAASGLTIGGFYNHFRNKEAVLAAELHEFTARSRKMHEKEKAKRPAKNPRKRIADRYLSEDHRDNVEYACNLPLLSVDVTRASDETRRIYDEALGEIIDRTADLLNEGDRRAARAAAIELLSRNVGALLLARAVHDPDFSREILRTCRSAASREDRL